MNKHQKKRYTVFQVLPFKHCDNDSASTKKYSIATKNNDTLLDGVPSISIQLNTAGELELTTSARMKVHKNIDYFFMKVHRLPFFTHLAL